MFSKRLIQRSSGILFFSIVALIAFSTAPASASVCALADHIRSANTNTAVGFCPAGTSHDVITIADDLTLTEPLPPIRGTITIEGGGHRISGDKRFPIFIVKGGNLTVNNLTFVDGYGGGSWDTEWVGAGAIQLFNGARVTVNHGVFIGNASRRGHGGAIGVDKSWLEVNSSAFLNNLSSGQGGAIYVWDSAATINNSSFVSNRASGVHRGGGIYVGFRGKLAVVNSAFYRNRAYEGGAVGSETTSKGPRSTTLTHVTMIDNSAARGQNIYIDKADYAFNLYNSILYSRSGESCEGRLNANISNLISDGSCAPALSGDPLVGELSSQPGYFPLLDGSPALDAADARFCPATDQIGAPKPQGAGCDIGAIESASAVPAPTPLPGICALQDQIIAANRDAAYRGCPAGNGADTIYMIRDYRLSATLPAITSEITIIGDGHSISGDGRYGIMEVDGGELTIKDVSLIEGVARTRGGAIRILNGGAVTAVNINFRDNEAILGGAISTESDDDRLAVARSRFIGNRAENFGGALLVAAGRGEVGGSVFLDNRADETGGAVAVAGGKLTLRNSTLTGNQAKKGGGVYVAGGEAILTHATLMNNVAERIRGAGIYVERGAASLRNSIVAGSGKGDDCSGNMTEARGNISEDGACSMGTASDPMLLAIVEKPSIHYPLPDASPAHGAGDPAYCLDVDQLGNPRRHCDSGAIESTRAPNYSPEPRAAPPVNCSLAEQIIAANSDAPVGSCPAGQGADVIRLRADIALNEPLPAITSELTIHGNGHAINGQNRSSIFVIDAGAVVLKNMTLINGSKPEGNGGAIIVRNRARLTVANVIVRGNRARYGGAIAAEDASHLEVFDSIFIDNAAEIRGGAVWNDGACGNLDNNQFRRSRAGSESRSQTESGLKTEIHLDGGATQCTPDMMNFFNDN